MLKSVQRKKTLRKSNGFSLVELLAVLGIAGAGTLGLMQLQKSQLTGQKKVEAKYDATTMANSIGTLLLSKESCEQTFAGRNFSSAQNPQTLTTIRRALPGGDVVNAYVTPLDLGNITITRFEYRLNGPLVGATGKNRYGNFNVTIVYRNNSRMITNSKEERIEVPFAIKLETNPTNGFLSCYSDISDIGDEVAARTCASVGGTFDPLIPSCSLTSHPGLPSPGVGSNLVLDNYRLINFADFRNQIYPRLFRDNFVYRMQGGDIVNGSIQMQNNAPFRVTNVINNLDVVNKKYADELFPNCSTGTVGIFTDGGMRCENLLCQNTGNGTQQYLAGFNPDGTKICHPLVNESGFCANGGSLKLGSNGALEYQCCTPACTNPSNYCSNEVFPSDNGCGNCIGSKPPTDATWGAWTNTGRSRAVAGATCSASCGGGVMLTEVEQVRVCNNNSQCGGSSCTGNSQQWVLGPSQPCNTQACAPAGKCVGYGSDSSNLFILGAPDTGSCGEGYRYQYLDIVVSQFKRGNIYSVTQGQTYSEEAKAGDTPQTVLQRLANKINSAPAISTGACGTSPNQATVTSSNRMRYRVQWQHSTLPSASRSCNNLDETTCSSTPGCNWDTTSANVCTGWNYTVEVGTCNGTYYRPACAWNGFGSGSNEQCQYGYYDQTSCNSSEAASKGCYWGSVQQTCYAPNQSQCSALGGSCTWKKYPDVHRSCTAASYESACTGDGAGVCTWGPR